MVYSPYYSVVLYGVGMFAAVLFAIWPFRNSSRDDAMEKADSDSVESFLLRNGKLLDANFAARRKLASYEDDGDLERLRRLLLSRFDEVDRLLGPAEQGEMSLLSRDGALQILREVAGDEVRLEIEARHRTEPSPRDKFVAEADAAELEMLRANTRAAPFLMWRQNRKGEVVWANQSYITAAARIFDPERMSTWPIPPIFKTSSLAPAAGGDRVRRVRTIEDGDGASSWFDCHVMGIDGDTLCTAFNADEVVRSEARRQEFTQTLTKTFSDLAIGLAIFDRSRRLVLFNPALTDLTSLPVDFLSNRPSLVSFLDRLRESRVMPEPRDYRSWRQSISDLEAASMEGTYSETWSLPDGQTYRVSGRPHPDGALALLIEDISAEMSLTRRFRAQLEQSQGVIDSLDEAVAVFSASGQLTFSNQAYKALWGDEAANESAMTVIEATRQWHDLTVPTPIWGDFRDFAFQDSERNEWSAEVSLRDGRQLACRFLPQKGGTSLAVFQVKSAATDEPEELRKVVG